MSVVPLSGLLGGVPGAIAMESQSVAMDGPAHHEAVTSPEPFWVCEHELPDCARDAERASLLPVLVPAPKPADRGQLALVIEEAIETALERRGACPPGVGAASDLDASLGDQLYRARLVELRGLFVALGPLEGICTLGGALDATDSAVLRWWLDAGRQRPVRLALDARNRSLGVYGPPVALAELVRPRPEPFRETVPAVSPELAASSATMELSEPPPQVAERVEVPAERVEVSTERADDAAERADAASSTDSAPAGADVLLAAETPKTPPLTADTAAEPHLVGELARALVAELTEPRNDPPADAAAPSEAEAAPNDFAETPQTPFVHELVAAAEEAPPESGERVAEAPSPSDEPAPFAKAESATTAAATPAEPEPRPPLHPDAATEWSRWLAELENARGPKPLGAIERMFVTSYVPLRDAYLRGIAPPEVGSALEGWAASFAKSYTEAFNALRVRGKRPTMVLDVPDAAHRIGRLHGARSVQLLLVDGLRFDLGLRIEQDLRARLGREVALTERLLLWSALPSDTRTQLELIGRGADGLRELPAPAENDLPVARGRMAKSPRRVKAGHRELLKLDLVEARLAEPGPPEAIRLDAVAHEVSSAVAELAEKLPPRTLLMVFGDHGFILDPQGTGTGVARQGGARPEEVLVPAFAWLIGGVQ